MSPRDLDPQLRAARPADPVGQDLRAASVRVIARLAMLESGARAADDERVTARRVRPVPVLAAAACLLLALLGTVQAPSATVPLGALPVPAPDALALQVEAALSGDVLARRRVLAAGPRARAALLDHVLDVPTEAPAALALLRASGGIHDDVEAARLALIVPDPALRDAAVDLLAAAPTTAGVVHLGRLLREDASVEAAVVAGLLRAAERGRRGTAVAALVRGAAVGRVEAAAAAIRIGSGRSALAALDALPTSLLLDPRIVAACRAAVPTTRDRLVRRSAAGAERVLRVAAAARLDGVVPLLAERAIGEDAEAARRAVSALAMQERPEAWLDLVRALAGAAGDEAREALGAMPRAGVAYLARVARTEPRRRALAIQGLALAGEEGLDALARLATRPALYGLVVDVLQHTPSAGAVEILAGLATAGRDEGRALVALSRRLEGGERGAGVALLALVEDHDSRQALRLLARYGAGAGLDWLARAATRPTLRPAARELLRRALRRAQAAQGGPPRTGPTRSGARPIT